MSWFERAKPKHFSQEEVMELVEFAKQSDGTKRKANYTYPTISVQATLEYAIQHPTMEREIRLGKKYLEIFEGANVQEVARSVYSIMNEGGEALSRTGNEWCGICEGYYLPHEH